MWKNGTNSFPTLTGLLFAIFMSPTTAKAEQAALAPRIGEATPPSLEKAEEKRSTCKLTQIKCGGTSSPGRERRRSGFEKLCWDEYRRRRGQQEEQKHCWPGPAQQERWE